MNNIAPQSPVMRRLTQQDNPAIARVIRQVSAEYGLTADKGYTVADPNRTSCIRRIVSRVAHIGWLSTMVKWSAAVDCAINREWSRTFANCRRCIFFRLFAVKGWRKKLALMAMEQAREMGFKRCYLETTAF